MPTAIEMTRIWSTLNEKPIEPSPLSEPSRPSTLAGTRPVRKSSQDPVLDGALAASEPDAGVVAGLQDQAEHDADRHRDEGGGCEPGQRLPGQARGIGDLTQVGDRGHDREEDQGGTTARSSVTNVPPTVLRVSVSQLGSTSPVEASTPSAPMLRATSPSATPRTRPIRTWTPNEEAEAGRLPVETEVLMLREDLSGAAPRGGGCGRRVSGCRVSRRHTGGDTARSRCGPGRRHDAASAGPRRRWRCARLPQPVVPATDSVVRITRGPGLRRRRVPRRREHEDRSRSAKVRGG